MDDLRVAPGPGAPDGIIVPAGEFVEHFSHSGGPGGQGVNTTDSRVQVSLDLATTSALNDVQRQRVLSYLATRLSGSVLTVTATDERSQLRNRLAGRERIGALLREAVAPPVVRRATKPTAGSRRRRLEAKRRTSETKRQRRRPGSD